jgi:hypothetical protein
LDEEKANKGKLRSQSPTNCACKTGAAYQRG